MAFLIALAVCCLLCGPLALVISLIALVRSTGPSPAPIPRFPKSDAEKKLKILQETLTSIPEPVVRQSAPAGKPQTPPVDKQKTPPQEQAPAPQKPLPASGDSRATITLERGVVTTRFDLEQRIGTRWVLIAGVICVIVGVGFFLKYAYDNWGISPLARVLVVAASGFVALAIGEVTRRRRYEIVARAVTALGFAILYIAVFAANRFYHLIGATPALLLVASITSAAMIYAVALDEIVAALLALFGGFVTPVMLATLQSSPTPLFLYALILGGGAMGCAWYRKWRSVNLLAFVGTFLLYTQWFEQKYIPVVRPGELPQQMAAAVIWLAVFFALYLLMPILYGLARKVRARKEDVFLVLANAAITFYYLWSILFSEFRTALALAAGAIGAIHLTFMCLVIRRCKDDTNLRIALQAIGLFFLIIALPLYFKMYALAMAWAGLAVILAVIGLRYKSGLTQAAGAIALALSIGQLIFKVPLHTSEFRLVLNPTFGTWCFVAGAVCLGHLVYRRTSLLSGDSRQAITEVLFAMTGLLIFAAATVEWYAHCRYNLNVDITFQYISRGQLVIFSAIVLFFAAKGLCPPGALSEVLSFTLLAAGSVFTIVALTRLHTNTFIVFANPDFLLVLVFLAAMLLCHIKYRRIAGPEPDQERNDLTSQVIYAGLGLLLLAAIAAEWYWHCRYNLGENIVSAALVKGQVLIFAAIMLLFVIRPLCPTGIISPIIAFALAAMGSVFTIANFHVFYDGGFTIFANTGFLIVLSFVAAVFGAAWLTNRRRDENRNLPVLASAFALLAVFTLWVLLTQQIYLYWRHRNGFGRMPNWKFLAHMYISILWAVYGAILMVVGFWKNFRILRYMSLALLALLLAKVFIFDTSEVKSVYRIAAFLATGITMVAISYLYQFLKKEGFFDTILKS